ncbi:hypothetical protein [Pseudomonas sp. CLCA07]
MSVAKTLPDTTLSPASQLLQGIYVVAEVSVCKSLQRIEFKTANHNPVFSCPAALLPFACIEFNTESNLRLSQKQINSLI